ncbi:hypothetical protein, partial [Bacillus smithii]|uniref:hypothetical protein n=1 Tax=Bacillus smithii TaxID=1479 RepID=UPI001C9CB37F
SFTPCLSTRRLLKKSKLTSITKVKKIYTKLPTTGSSAFLLTFFGLCLGLPASARNIRGNLGNYFHRKKASPLLSRWYWLLLFFLSTHRLNQNRKEPILCKLFGASSL